MLKARCLRKGEGHQNLDLEKIGVSRSSKDERGVIKPRSGEGLHQLSLEFGEVHQDFGMAKGGKSRLSTSEEP